MSDNSLQIAFHKTIRRIMSPLVDIAIEYGVSVNDLSQWLRALYVERAEHFTLKGKRQSASRIALLTGLDRKEVAKIRKLNENIEHLLQHQIAKTNHAIRAVNAWQKEPGYSSQGEANILPIQDGDFSLKSLVNDFCGDVSLKTLLDELKRAEMVELLDNQTKVKLLHTSYVPNSDKDQLLGLMGQAAQDLITTCSYNLNNPDVTRFQLTLAYNDVHEELAEKLKIVIEKDSMELMTKLNNWLNTEIDLKKECNEENAHTKRAGVGIYYFEDPLNKTDQS